MRCQRLSGSGQALNVMARPKLTGIGPSGIAQIAERRFYSPNDRALQHAGQVLELYTAEQIPFELI